MSQEKTISVLHFLWNVVFCLEYATEIQIQWETRNSWNTMFVHNFNFFLSGPKPDWWSILKTERWNSDSYGSFSKCSTVRSLQIQQLLYDSYVLNAYFIGPYRCKIHHTYIYFLYSFEKDAKYIIHTLTFYIPSIKMWENCFHWVCKINKNAAFSVWF